MNSKRLDACNAQELSHCRKLVFAFLSLAALILLIYSNSFNCSWQFDDEPNITDNTNIHLEEISWHGIKQAIFSNARNPNFPYRPVACLSLALNYYFGQKEVLGYHIVNTSIHYFSAILLFLFIHSTLNSPKLKYKYSTDSYSLALITTVFWTINPVQVQAITYIVQRMASLAGLFFIMTMYFYLKGRVSDTPRQAHIYFALSILSFLMAIGSKENAAILPLVIFAYEILIIQENTTLFLKTNFGTILVIVFSFLLLGLIYLYFRSGNIFSFLNSYETVRPFSLTQRLLTETRVIILYITLLIYPITDRLNISHSIDLSNSLIDPISTLLSILIIVFLFVIALYIASKEPIISFCILFFILTHLIESSIFPLEIIYEHRNYIPSMLFFLPLAIGACRLIKRYKAKWIMQYSLLVFISFITVGFGHATYLRNFDWKTPETLWRDALNKSPDIFRPYNNLARHYQQLGLPEEALQLYKKGMGKKANNRNNEKFIAYYNIGNYYNNSGNYDSAEYFYRKARSLNPLFAPTYNNMAILFDKQGKQDLARKFFLKALDISSNAASINLNLGLSYIKTGQPHQAELHLKKAMALQEHRERCFRYLGIAYKHMGLLGLSAVNFHKAIEESPFSAELRLHLAEVYQVAGHRQLAEEQAGTVLDLINDMEHLQKIVAKSLSTGTSKRIHPDGYIVLPLLQTACVHRGSTLNKWSQFLSEQLSEKSSP